MTVMLGNLSIGEIEKRLGIEFPLELKEFMRSSHQADAQHIQKNKWHCFDIPFNLVCGDVETATKIYSYLKDKGSLCKEPMQISIQKNN